MRATITLLILAFVGLAAPCPAYQADDDAATKSASDDAKAAKEDDAKPEQVLLHVLQSRPAQDASNALSQIFRGADGLTIVADVQGNALLVRGPRERIEEVSQVLKQLDQPPKITTFELFRVEVLDDTQDTRKDLSGSLEDVKATLEKLQSQKTIFVSDEIQLSAMENQTARVQVGKRASVITGSMMSSRGRTNTSQFMDVGTLLSLTHRVSNSQVVIDFDFEKSDVEQPPATNDDPVVAPDVATSSLQTSVVVQDGHATIVEGVKTRSSSGVQRDVFLVLGARVHVAGAPVTRGKPTTVRSQTRPTAESLRSKPSPFPTRSPYATYSQALMKRYDENNNGELEPEEWSEMATSPADADSNDDKKITVDEFAKWLQTRGSTARPSGSGRPSGGSAGRPVDNRYQRYAEGIIGRYDADNDKQLDSQEWAKSEMLRDADEADANEDGKIDAKELGNWLEKRRSR